MSRKFGRVRAAALVTGLFAAGLAGCSSGGAAGGATTTTPTATETGASASAEASGEATASDAPISDDRCEANKAAGTITYLDQFAFAAMPSQLDVVAAEELGYFDSLCLDVDIRTNTDNNAQIVSAGTAQMAGLGSAADALTALDQDAKDIVGIATYGNTPAIEILTMADSGIDSLEDFTGRTVGYKVSLSPILQAMFAGQGVDPSGINWVSVGFDPQLLPDGQVEGLGAFKSNEPKVLASRGYDVREWDPAEYGIDATFDIIIANTDWAAANPTAVEDFLRATLHAYDWIQDDDANLDEALGWAEARSEAGYDVALSKVRWQTESGLVESSLPDGFGIGMQSVDTWQPEADLLVEYGLVETAPDLSTAFDDSYVEAIYDGTTLIWPAP